MKKQYLSVIIRRDGRIVSSTKINTLPFIEIAPCGKPLYLPDICKEVDRRNKNEN